MTTAYTVLGVVSTATAEEIASAYRAKAKEHHPDRGGDPKVMARVNLAWSKLKTPAARAAYDLKLRDLERAAAQSAPAPAEQAPQAVVEGLIGRMREASRNGVEAAGVVAEMAQAQGLVDASGAARVRNAGGKVATITRDLADLFSMFRG